ncbi:MAG: TRAM domain-containing protein [Candidatus Obscuribacterales bacterium]
MKRNETELKKNMRVKLRISSLAAGGEGVAKDLGVPVFVSRVAPGDLVTAELFDVRKNFARGKVVQIDEPSDQRSEPPCKIFKVCGGCQWQHIDYRHQLSAKQDIVKQAIKHIGKLDPEVVLPVMGGQHFFAGK